MKMKNTGQLITYEEWIQLNKNLNGEEIFNEIKEYFPTEYLCSIADMQFVNHPHVIDRFGTEYLSATRAVPKNEMYLINMIFDSLYTIEPLNMTIDGKKYDFLVRGSRRYPFKKLDDFLCISFPHTVFEGKRVFDDAYKEFIEKYLPSDEEFTNSGIDFVGSYNSHDEFYYNSINCKDYTFTKDELKTELLKFKYLYKIQTMYQSKIKKEYEHLILQNDYMFDTVISYIVSGVK